VCQRRGSRRQSSVQLLPRKSRVFYARTLLKLGRVDHDERLRITGIEPGRYDVKLADRIGRICIVRDVEVKAGAVFAIEEKQLVDCRN
jgi:hypothetical protein